jgi:hypothetical protein
VKPAWLLLPAAVLALVATFVRCGNEAGPAVPRTKPGPGDSVPESVPVGAVAASADRVPVHGPCACRQELVHVRVVEASSGRAVAGARVRIESVSANWEELEEARLVLGGIEPALDGDLGVELASDARGELVLAARDVPYWICARSGELFAARRIDADELDVVLRLAPELPLEVEVVDARGQPAAGVHVVLSVYHHQSWDWPAWSGLTDDGGIARIPDLRSLTDEPDALLALGLPLVRSTPAQIEFGLEDLPRERVRFVLGPTCEVELVLVDEQGVPVSATVELELDLVVAGWTDLPMPTSACVLERLSRTGRIVFPHVALDLKLEGDGYRDDLRVEPQALTSPSAPGARKVVELPFEACGRVRGRVRCDGIESWRDCEVTAFHENEIFSTELAADGSFADTIGSDPDSSVASVVIRVRRDHEIVAVGTVAWPEAAQRRDDLALRDIYDLGDVELQAAEPDDSVARNLPIAGRVVDARGQPISCASVRHYSVARMHARTDEDGRFRMMAGPPGSRFELRIDHENFPGVDVELASGATDVVIALADGGGLRGRLRGPDRVPLDDFDVHLIANERKGEDGCALRLSVNLDLDGRFERRALEPGAHGLEVRFESTVLLRRDFEVQARERVDLGDLDLRGIVRPIEIELADEHGRRIAGEIAVIEGEEVVFDESLDADESFVWPSRTAAPSVVAVAAGRRLKRFDRVRDGDRLVLEPGIPVRFELEHEMPDLGPDLRLELYLECEESEPYDEALSLALVADLDRSGRCEILVPRPGRYRVQRLLYTDDPLDSIWEESRDEDMITIPDAPSLHRISIDTDALAEFVRSRGDGSLPWSDD